MRIENETISRSQTLDRGLAILDELAEADRPLSTDELAARLGLHRSVVYRLVRTLEDRRLVERDAAGRFALGLRLAVLARSVQSTLRAAAVPVLATLADELRMTAFLVVRDGDEAVTIESAEPRSSEVHVAYRPGNRHSINRGAPGLALLAGAVPQPDERPLVTQCRHVGWVMTTAEVIPGMTSVASPISDAAALAVVFMAGQHPNIDDLTARVVDGARQIAARLFPS